MDSKRSKTSEPVAICVISHQGYLENLNLILKIWDSFAPKEWRRIISLDGCKFDNVNFPNWEIIENEFVGAPNVARNNALSRLQRGYVVFWDADNVPTKEYVDSIIRVSEENAEVFSWYPTMDLPYEPYDLRFCNFIDTASVIRVEMLKSLGGWNSVPCLQDWELNLRAMSHGFKSEPLNSKFVYCKHSESISSSYDPKEELPWIKSVGIICPMRGDLTLSTNWFKSLLSQKFSQEVGITIIDKSGDIRFSSWLRGQMNQLDFNRVSYVKDEPVKSQDFETIHNSVGKSYALGFASTPENLILTWEDDVIPKSPLAIQELIKNLFPLSPFHVVGAAVPTREDSSKLIASWNKEYWEGHIDNNITEVKQVGMLGGGLTLWNRRVLEDFGFQGMRYLSDEFPLGWDGWLCKRINQKYRIGIAPIPCIHER
jgi:hypothetical protein